MWSNGAVRSSHRVVSSLAMMSNTHMVIVCMLPGAMMFLVVARPYCAKTCAVIGFPNGTSTPAAKAAEASELVLAVGYAEASLHRPDSDCRCRSLRVPRLRCCTCALPLWCTAVHSGAPGNQLPGYLSRVLGRSW